jgi:ribosomal protein S18 acetylase RimI-like enzyme
MDDAESVLMLWIAADAEPTSTDDSQSIHALIAYDPNSLIVAHVGDRIVGTVIAAFDGWRGSLYRLAVHPSYRRQGMALTLVREGEQRLIGRGARRVTALVVKSHSHATEFWESAGYLYDERMGRYVNVALPSSESD